MKYQNEILEYLEGKLNEAQISDFKLRLESDQEFSEEYLTLKQMFSHLNERRYRSSYADEINKLNDQYFAPKSKKNGMSLKNILISSLLIIAGLLAAWYLLKPKTADLYESNSNHFALHLVVKSDQDQNTSNAERAFNNENFEEASIALNQYLITNSSDTKAKLALGICYLETENSNKAIAIFEEISNGSSTLKDYGTWYKALYYVKNSEYSKAKDILYNIPELDAQLFNKAQKLLKDLKTFEED